MSQRLLATKSFEAAPSSWRLVTLALGIAAVLGFAASVSRVTALIPSRWLLMPLFSPNSLESVPVPSIFLAKVGVNLWLPASVLLIVFLLLGFHRKLYASRKRVTIWLTLAWMGYIAFVALIFVLDAEVGSEAAGAVGLVFGLITLPFIGLLGAFGILAAMSEITALWQNDDPTPWHFPVAVLAWAMIPPVLLVMPLFLAPSNPLAMTAKENAEFQALCKDVGVRFLEAPAGPVRSVAFDWDPQVYLGRKWERYESDGKGRLTSGRSGAYASDDEAKKRLDLDFIEGRTDLFHSGPPHTPDLPLLRFYRDHTKQPSHRIEAFTADLLVSIDVYDPKVLKRNYLRLPALQYRLQVTDRRSGAVLGRFVYVVDLANWRGCGANIGATISHEAFIYDVINR